MVKYLIIATLTKWTAWLITGVWVLVLLYLDPYLLSDLLYLNSPIVQAIKDFFMGLFPQEAQSALKMVGAAKKLLFPFWSALPLRAQTIIRLFGMEGSLLFAESVMFWKVVILGFWWMREADKNRIRITELEPHSDITQFEIRI